MPYTEPGNTNDLSPAAGKLWVEELSRLFDIGIDVAKAEADPASSRSWFFNPITDGTQNTSEAVIRWNAFPRRLTDESATPLIAWRKADETRDRQEEYCEWEVVRQNNKVIRVTFTTETPDYYRFLFKNDPDVLLTLYRKHVSPQVQLSDLSINGSYLQTNKWNYPETDGKRGVLMHMGYRPNTLDAAISLAAGATWPSVDNQGNLITDEQGLILCRGYGEPERHSDPHIGAQINALTRTGLEVSFAGPPGLYIDEVDFTRFAALNGFRPQDIMKVVRGDSEHMMRIIFEAPPGSNFTLSDVKIDGENILFGGQIAQTLTIRVSGIARPAAQAAPKINCSGQAQITPPVTEQLASVGTRKMTVSYMASSE
jgi:hypothetical protein